jgi:Copper type II ascorbate-dependent monooxygenase, C-terminal domain
MRCGNRGAGATRAGRACLWLAACAGSLATAALGQSPAPGKQTSAVVARTRTDKTAPAAPAQTSKPAPTYTKDVAPILQAKCQNCHRRHQVGPFGLETYEQARKRSGDIAAVTGERSMPPWKPTAGVGPKLKHDKSLTDAEIAILTAWAEAGAPRGDPKDMPPPPKFAEGWKLGPPDLILIPREGFPVPADGPDVYRCFVLPTNLANDSYLEAVDYAPSEPGAVHHLIAYIDVTGRARQLDQADQGPGYKPDSGPGFIADELSFWTAGTESHRLPPGIGISLPAQSDIVLQVHYHPSGKAGLDSTRVGLYFSRKPPKQALHWNNASSFDFRLPPGQNNIVVKASWYIPVDLEAIAVSPHMHLLGRDMHMSVRLPNGRTENLIEIANWDPSWQSAYYFQKPVTLIAGSILNVVAHYDNSAHARNPNQPPKLVKLGPNFDDEMCVGYIAVVKKGQDLTAPGARDDLHDIFVRQRERLFRKQFTKKSH